jgi:hypothetical protein
LPVLKNRPRACAFVAGLRGRCAGISAMLRGRSTACDMLSPFPARLGNRRASQTELKHAWKQKSISRLNQTSD